MPHEKRNKVRLSEVLPQADVPYDEEVFPDDIILEWCASIREVHDLMINGLTRPNFARLPAPEREQRFISQAQDIQPNPLYL